MFENLHSSHKAAFVDGFLTALVITYFVNAIRKDRHNPYLQSGSTASNVTPLYMED